MRLLDGHPDGANDDKEEAPLFKEGEFFVLERYYCYSAACSSRSHDSCHMTLFDLDRTWNFANESRNVISGNSFDRLLKFRG